DPISSTELKTLVEEAAQILGLADLLARRPDQLSGGEQQRVALGRAVVARAGLWLLDEPLGHLDPLLRERLRDELVLLQERFGPTIIHVTHDPVEAVSLGNRVAVLRAGGLEQIGRAADLLADPRSRSVATSLGWPPINLVDGKVVGPEGHPTLVTPE